MTKVYDLKGNSAGEAELPRVFSTLYRPDLIKKAVQVLQASRRQVYGPSYFAGLRTSAHYHGMRHSRYTMMNREVARLPRAHNTSPAQEWRAKVVPQATGGRKAHPPKTEKVVARKMNKKEMKSAIRSAIAATASLELVKKRGHRVPEIELPIVVKDDLHGVSRAKDLRSFIASMKLKDELERGKQKKVRAGKGKMRGRKYKRKKSILIVVGEDKGVLKASKNLSGVDACAAKDINIELLAPGCHAGRLTIWSESAVRKIGEMYG